MVRMAQTTASAANFIACFMLCRVLRSNGPRIHRPTFLAHSDRE
jgi:hypothetical protein